MVEGSNDAFSPKEVPFGLIEKISVYEVNNPLKPPKSIKTHIAVKSRDIDTKFELQVETQAYTLDFGSKGTYHQIQDGGSRHFEKLKL
jgi:hypothetical protein